MKIKLKEITIRELTTGYQNDNIEGVVGFGGALDIRPKYQREFIYNDKQRNAVIDTVNKSFPLNIMYWVKNSNGYEVLDGQQRTISICEYVAGSFSLNNIHFHNLEPVEQEKILNYKLMVYFCEGHSKEKLDWFQTINIAGEELTKQELRNAVYSGTWATDAKKYFSKTGGAAYSIGNKYLKGKAIRQDYFETALKWITDNNIEEYMAVNQHKQNANELWQYFQNVIAWVELTFPNYRKEMKGVDFGKLYNTYKDEYLDTDELETEIVRLMQDEDVTKKAGIYTYVLTKNEKYLSVRSFSDNNKRESYEHQKGICTKCNDHFELNEMEADHITPWVKGGKTVSANCQMLCTRCNRTKSDK